MKHTTMLVRVLLMLLSLCMLVGAFAACGTEVAGENTSEKPNATEAPASTEDLNLDANGYWKDNVPDGLNYGDVCLILAADNQKGHFWAEESDTSNVGQAIFQRNATVEERLGIEIKWDPQPNFHWNDQ